MKQIYDKLLLPVELHYFQYIALFFGCSLCLLGNIFDISLQILIKVYLMLLTSCQSLTQARN